MGMVKETPPVRRFAGIGRWLVGGTPGSRHRDVQGGTQRATVLGAGDGLLTNLSLVLGVAGATTNASAVRLAGVASLLAGAFSMAAGELVSVRAQQEMVEREVQVERQELADDPEGEQWELAGMYRAQGLSEEDASAVARILSANPGIALDTHARLELGVDPQAPGSAWQAAIMSFLSFSVGAVLPLFPWFFSGLQRGYRLGDHRRHRGAGARGGDRLHVRAQRAEDCSAAGDGGGHRRRGHLRGRVAARGEYLLTGLVVPELARRRGVPAVPQGRSFRTGVTPEMTETNSGQ